MLTETLSVPIGLLILGVLLLTAAVFFLARRKSGEKSGNAVDSSGQVVRSARLLEEIEHEIARQVAAGLKTISSLQDEREKCQAAVTEVRQTLGRLERLIDIFDDTFFARQSSRTPVDSLSNSLRQEVASEVSSLRTKYNDLAAAAEKTIGESPSPILANAAEILAVDIPVADIPTAGPIPIGHTPPVDLPSNEGTFSRGKEVRRLLKSGKQPEEIATELGIPLDQVELVISVLDPGRKVA